MIGRGGDNADGPPGDEIGDVRTRRWVETAAELLLASERLVGPAPLPDFDDLRDRRARARTRRRVAFALVSMAAAGATAWVLVAAPSGGTRGGAQNGEQNGGRNGEEDGRPDGTISYVVEGAATTGGADTIAAPPLVGAGTAARETRVRFSDGTLVALEPGARLRVAARTATGAELILDQGRSWFTVAHRSGARWRVAAGPFAVDVTGTRFSLDWKSDEKRLTLDLASGGVIVRGDVAGAGVAVRPGERLVASPTGQHLSVVATPEASPTPGGTPGATLALQATAPASPSSVSSPSASPSPSPSQSNAGHPTEGRRPRRRLAVASPGAQRPPRESPGASRAAERLDLQPPPATNGSAANLTVGGGGVFCAADRAAFGFEDAPMGVSVPPLYHLALGRPRPNSSHSWCGTGSLRLDAGFHESGRRNFMGRFPHQSGQVVVRLPQRMDFTNKTVSAHVFIDGPPDARLAAQLFVIHHGKWVNAPLTENLTAGRWWTISHKFRADNPLTVGPPYPPAGTSEVTECDRIALIVYATGGPRTWSGAIYVDDLGWK